MYKKFEKSIRLETLAPCEALQMQTSSQIHSPWLGG